LSEVLKILIFATALLDHCTQGAGGEESPPHEHLHDLRLLGNNDPSFKFCILRLRIDKDTRSSPCHQKENQEDQCITDRG
jgi:hypothetical protein